MSRLITNWQAISTQMWSRAARYSHAVRVAGTEGQLPAPSGFFFHSDLDRIDDAGPVPGAWWWIYVPLLRAMLDGSPSAAFLVGLGHHVRRPQGKDADRQWLHFLPADVLPTSETLPHLVWMASYNTVLPDAEKVPLLLSTAALEMLNAADHPSQPHSLALYPVLVDFGPGAASVQHFRSLSAAESIPLLTANWSRVREAILQIDSSFQLRDILKDHSLNLCQSPSTLSMSPTLSCLPASAITPAFRNTYRHIVDGRRGALKAFLKISDFPIEHTDDQLALDHHLPHIASGYGQDRMFDAVLNYNIWLHDLTPGRDNDWVQVVSALSWLPSITPRRRWSSIVIFLRAGGSAPEKSDAIFEMGQSAPLAWHLVPDLLASFAAASGYTADESARVHEQLLAGDLARVRDYLSNLNQPSGHVLVRRGDRCGALFNNVWFALPEFRGWRYIGHLIALHADGKSGLSAWQLCEALEALGVERPELRSEGLSNPSEADLDGGLLDKFQPESATIDDPKDRFAQWMLSMSDWLDDANAKWLSGEQGLQGLTIFVSVIASMLKERAQQPASIQQSPSLEGVLGHCTAVWTLISTHVTQDDDDWKVAGLYDELFELSNLTRAEKTRILDAIGTTTSAMRGYIRRSKDRATQARPGRRKNEEERCASAVVRVINGCIQWLKKQSAVVPSRRAGRDGLEPDTPETREAAVALGEHLDQQLKRSRARPCQYGGSMRFDEED